MPRPSDGAATNFLVEPIKKDDVPAEPLEPQQILQKDPCVAAPPRSLGDRAGDDYGCDAVLLRQLSSDDRRLFTGTSIFLKTAICSTSFQDNFPTDCGEKE